MQKTTLSSWARSGFVPLALVLALGSLGSVLIAQQSSEPRARTPRALAEFGGAAIRWAREIEDLQRAGSLRLQSSRADTMIEGRIHDRFAQYSGEARILGAGNLVSQRSAVGVETVFGALLEEEPRVETKPGVSATQLRARYVSPLGQPLAGMEAELVLVPSETGELTLAWLDYVVVSGDVLGSSSTRTAVPSYAGKRHSGFNLLSA